MNEKLISLLQKENEEQGNEIIRLTRIIKNAIKFIESEAINDSDLGTIYTTEEIKLLKILKGEDK